MKRITIRTLLAAGLVVVPLAGASYARPSWPSDLGLDFWEAPVHQARLQHEKRVRTSLEQRDAIILRRIRIKDELIADLVAGQSSLLETASRFQRLNASETMYLSMMRQSYPGKTDGERICRNVIAFAEAAFPAGSPEATQIVARLNAELAEVLKETPQIELP